MFASVESLIWQIEWIQAFPCLLTRFLFTDEPDIMWQRLALSVIRQNITDQSQFHIDTLAVDDNNDNDKDDDPNTAWNSSLGYGEITEETVFTLMDMIRKFGNIPQNPCVVDLGSGSGKVLLVTSLVFPLSSAIGIEIVPSLHKEALVNYSQWNQLDMNCTFETDNNGQNNIFEWICDDFTTNCMWVPKADIVLIHATVFDETLMDTLNQLCARCKTNTFYCVVSKKLQAKSVETITVIHLPLSWGFGEIFIQKKL